MKRAGDKGTESLPVSIVFKSVELKNNEHAISSKAAWRAETKENILEKAPKHPSASTIAPRFASRLVTGRFDRYVYQLLNWYSGKIDVYMPDRTRRTYRRRNGRVIAPGLKESAWQYAMEVRGTQASFDSAKRRGRTKTSSRIPTKCTLTEPSSTESCSNEAKLQKVKNLLAPSGQRCRLMVTVLEARRFTHCRMRAGRGFECIWAVDELIKAMTEAEKADRQSISSAATTTQPPCNVDSEWYIAKFEWTKIPAELLIDNKDNG